MTDVDLDTRLRLHPKVAIRPEPFGALLYHFDNRKLSFLKDRTLLQIVEGLGQSGTVREACLAAGVGQDRLPVYLTAIRTLVDSQMLLGGNDDTH